MPHQCVFVSYSRTATAPARQGLDEILAALSAQQFQRGLAPDQTRCVLIDEAVAPGEPWRERLYEWLEQCDQAIIYCAPEVPPPAAASTPIFEHKNWLFHEASVLAHRRHVGTLKELIPVYAYIEMDAHPFAKLNALYLQRFQAVFFRDGEERQPIIDRIIARLCADHGAGNSPGGGLPAQVMEYRQHTAAWLSAFAHNIDNQQLQLQALINLTPAAETRAASDYFNRRLQDKKLHDDLATRLMMGPCLSPPGWDRPLSYHQTYCVELRQLYTKGYTATRQPAGAVAREATGLYDVTEALATSWVRAETALEIGAAVARECRLFWVKVDTGPVHSDPDEAAAALEDAERLYPQLLRDLILASYHSWHNLVDFGGKTNLRDLVEVFAPTDQLYARPGARYITLDTAANPQHALNTVLGLPLDTAANAPQQRAKLRALRKSLDDDYHELRVIVDCPREQQSFFVRHDTLALPSLHTLRQHLPRVFVCLVTPASVVAEQPLDQAVIIEISAAEYQAAQALRTTLEKLQEDLGTGQAG